MVAHADELPEPGSYRRLDQVSRPVILVRDEDGTVKAFYNTCKHRGSALVLDDAGTTGQAAHLPVPQLGVLALGRARRLPGAEQLLRPRPRLPRPHHHPVRVVGPARLHQLRSGRRAAPGLPGPGGRRPQRARRDGGQAPTDRPQPAAGTGELEGPGRRQHRDLPRELRPQGHRSDGVCGRRRRGSSCSPTATRGCSSAFRTGSTSRPRRSRSCSTASATFRARAPSRTTSSRT